MITTPTKPLTQFDYDRIVDAARAAGVPIYDDDKPFKHYAWVGIDTDGELVGNHSPDDYGPGVEVTYSLNRFLEVVRSARKPGAARCVMRAPACGSYPA